MEKIKKCYDGRDIKNRPKGAIPFNDASLWARINLQPFGKREWTAIARCFSRTWFHRMWMVQETVLASAIEFLCGSQEFSWEVTGLFSRWLNEIGWEHELGLNSGELIPEELDLKGLLANRRLFYLAIAMRDNSATVMIKNDQRRLLGASAKHDSPGARLAALLMHCRGRLATDHRDQVFALLGLLPSADSPDNTSYVGLDTDYRQSILEVYTETARRIILHTNRIGIMSLADQDPSTRDSALPSWVPDLRTQYDSSIVCMPRIYDAAAGFRRSRSGFEMTNLPSSMLEGEGICLDIIAAKTGAIKDILSPLQGFDLGKIIDFVCSTSSTGAQQGLEPRDLLFNLLTRGSLVKIWLLWPDDETRSASQLEVPRDTALAHYQRWLCFYISAFSRAMSLPNTGLYFQHEGSAKMFQSSPLYKDVSIAVPSYYERYLSIMTKDAQVSNCSWDREAFDRELLTPMRYFDQLCHAAGYRCLLRSGKNKLIALGPP